MSGQLPSIFISSTFYDLKQILAELSLFVERELGYRFLASEHSCFPVEPDTDTVENCRRRVEQDADVFVLIIGGRYGSEAHVSGKSVTNLQYLTARAKRIPVFAFVARDVLALMPIWERDPTADFTGSVDTPKLFEFIKEVRTTDSVWTFPFDRAQDITETLRTQFAYVMRRGLHLSAQMRGRESELEGLSGAAFRIAVEQPDGWQGKLFAQVISDEVNSAADQRRQHDSGMALGAGERVTEADMPDWVASFIGEAARMTGNLTKLLNDGVNSALKTSDTKAIVYGARQVGQMYRDTLEWSARLRRAHIPEDWRPVINEMSHMVDDVVEEMHGVSARLHREIDAVLTSAEPKHLTFSVTLKIRDTRFDEELDNLRRRRGLN